MKSRSVLRREAAQIGRPAPFFDAAEPTPNSTDAPCLCDDIDPSDRPCLVCEARAAISSGETGKGA